MVNMKINNRSMNLELRGDDETVISELSLATVRILDALEKADGNEFDTNLTYLILALCKLKDERNQMKNQRRKFNHEKQNK